ncbi:transcription factor RelB homolog isoform X2 [Corythoichthys intestinalis]|uniref:transcription factor RelB homolog isoform X2 n=1 Tax=Corythoichthys intestinalis TaxID=161448 RepID=UPI0025A5FCAA|nr:transcription factor RelB homolog isoform X2 [Corythoichthys intestinalis]XP_061797521.1 transcription factor RelB homolog [Nerophis lumbriciformis]
MDVFRCTPERGVSDFDLIQEIITEDHTGVSLPRLPPPPPHGLRDQNRRMHRLCSSSPPSQPVLVPRGTTCQSSCTFQQPLQQLRPPREMSQRPSTHSTIGCRHAQPSQTAKHPGATVSSKSCSGVEMLERNLEKPKLVVVEQPKERGMRFRYECEGRSAGSILGASGSESNKTQPAVEIQGSVEHLKKVTVTVSLVTKDPPHRPHPHCLVGKDCPTGSGICVVTLNPQTNRRHSFANLGIQCVRRKELDVSLQKRRSQNIDPFQTGHSKGIEDMDMNAVRLCFQCELEWEDGTVDSLSPVVSNPIYDKKATTTSQLKISQLNQYKGSCAGKTEIYMLCDKVQKDDIEIIFRHGSWKANGEFAQTDVHRQIAIVFKTPPYREQDITDEVDVSVTLRRLSDQMESEPVTFTYLPSNPDPYEVKRKRKIKSHMNFQENTNVTADLAAAAPEQAFHFPHDMTSPRSTQPGLAPLGEIVYAEPTDIPIDSEEMDLLSQLLEMPGLMDMFSDPAAVVPDAGQASFGGANQNLGPYTQDFSRYEDLRFNMLVNENWNMQTEPQAGPSDSVHVKIEDDL